MSPAAAFSIEVWRDSGASAVVSVFQERRRIDRVTVIAGDCLDLQLDPGMTVQVQAMPPADDFREELHALAAAEAEET